MPPPRPRGVGTNAGVSSGRPSPNTPMSERQQMALLLQMTSTTGPDTTRSNSKKSEHKKLEDMDEMLLNDKSEVLEPYVEKSANQDFASDTKPDQNLKRIGMSPEHEKNLIDGTQFVKRNISDGEDENDCDFEEEKKKKRKDSDNVKDIKSAFSNRVPVRSDKTTKPFSTSKNSPKMNVMGEKDCLCESPKSVSNKAYEVDTDSEELKTSDMYSGALKVPPLKIVIPSQNCSIDTEGNVNRNGKTTTSRNPALPYVVTTSSESNERENNSQCNSPNESPIKNNNPNEEKNIKLSNEDKSLHRVLRSSHRSIASNIERSSNNSSPQLQSNSPSPASSTTHEASDTKTSLFPNTLTTSPILIQHQVYENDLPSPSTSSTSSSKEIQSSNVDLHPRKRKIRTKQDDSHTKLPSQTNTETTTGAETHPHDFPFTNCFQMYLNIRKQIEKKHKLLCNIKPRPPQGYADFLIKNRSYVLSEHRNDFSCNVPNSVSIQMRDIFIDQERERHDLSLRHTVERQKLSINVEQEILRVHTKAARSISCQPVPFSVCTLIKDEEVYNLITPEQEEKDRNARYRFNGRLLLSWLQDVDDKWEKIKDAMVLRHHNEAESLRAVQLMDWEIALKQRELCGYNNQLRTEDSHVPMVHVTDDFDLLPA